MQHPSLLAVLLLCGLLTCCTEQPETDNTGAAAESMAAESVGDSAVSATDADAMEPADKQALLQAAEAGITQLIILYTGDTISAVKPPPGFDPPQGGIPALAKAVAEYQRSIVYFNQLRVSEAGGDPSQIRADRASGMLGEHPYLLLDYGGWERPNDYAGAPYVGLYLTYFADYSYDAVGSKLYERLAPERWEAYAEVSPGVELVASAGDAQGKPLPTVKAVTREVHGGLWCIVAVPLPRVGNGDPFERIEQFADVAWEEVQRTGADYSILLMSEGPTQLYRDLAEDGRFTVIIGAPPRLAVRPGYGELAAGETLLLPELNPSGRQFSACHLQFDGSRPAGYHLLLNDCIEDESQPYPYRNQVKDAIEAHEQLVEEHLSAAKIGS